MLKKIKKKLIIEYTFFAALILTIGILIAIYMLTQQQREKYTEQLLDMASAVAEDVELEREINLWKLSSLASEHNAVIAIEENEVLLFPQEPNSLIEKAKELFFAKHPENVTGTKEERLEFSADGEKYEAYCYRIKGIVQEKGVYEDGYRMVIVVMNMAEYADYCRKVRLGFLAIDGLGILLFAFLSVVYVNRMIQPAIEANERQNRFINAVSHELRAPLAVIRVSNAAADGGKSSDIIEKECVRMAKLIEDMILLAGFNEKTWKINMAEADIDTVLLDTYDAYEPICREKNLGLKLCVEEQLLPKAYCDETRVRQVLAILLNNAVSYTKEGDCIILSGKEKEEQVVLSVEDHGPGIDEKEKKKIFERFYRVDASRSDSSHMGLGLSIASEILKLQGGSISVKDTPGGGATFCIMLQKRREK